MNVLSFFEVQTIIAVAINLFITVYTIMKTANSKLHRNKKYIVYITAVIFSIAGLLTYMVYQNQLRKRRYRAITYSYSK
jgi:hypothetical protein